MKLLYIVMGLLAPISLYYKRRDKRELIISFLLKGKLYWYLYTLPFITLSLYILTAFIGNRHISGF